MWAFRCTTDASSDIVLSDEQVHALDDTAAWLREGRRVADDSTAGAKRSPGQSWSPV